MSNSAALIIRNPLTPQVWEMISKIAPAMHQSRLFGVSSQEQAMAIMLKGHDLGLSPTAAFEFITVIGGKPGLNPRGALALIHNAPEKETIKITRLVDKQGKFEGYECYMKRKGGLDHTSRFTLADAKQAQLIKQDSGWDKYPENMCLWRAVGFAADVVFPDVCGGMKTADQYGATINQAGDVIVDGEWSVSANGTGPAAPDPVVPPLEALLQQYGPDAVMQANGGNIPATPEEVAAVAEKLNANGNAN